MFLFQIYYFSKCTLKTANKQYSSVNNDYEMTFNADTMIEPCNEDVSLPSMTFDFTKINELDNKQPNTIIGKFNQKIKYNKYYFKIDRVN